MASAATYNFRIDVTRELDAHGDVASFTPFSFVESWEINPSPFTSSIHAADPTAPYTEFATGTIVPGFSPLAAPMKTTVGLTSDAPSTESAFLALKRFNFTDPPLAAAYNFSVGEATRTSDDLGDGTFLERYHLTTISTPAFATFPTSDVARLDDAGLTQLLAETGPLSWVEWAQSAIHDPNGAGSYLTLAQVDYFGTATFVGVSVPEPSTWAIMLIGFGGIGAALRRRRVGNVAG
jgi:hypothetical protein